MHKKNACFLYSPYTFCGGHDELESESSNGDSHDLPYRHHKTAHFCQVCRTLMGRNKYALQLEYLYISTMCDLHALLTI